MNMYNLIQKIIDSVINCCRDSMGLDKNRYLRLWKYSVLIIILIAHTPLVIIAFIDHYHNMEYNRELNDLTTQIISKETTYVRQAGESFFNEQLSLIKFIIKNNSFESLSNVQNFSVIFNNLKSISSVYTALELLNSKGDLLTSAGNLFVIKKVNYDNQKWFHEVNSKGVYISDVSDPFTISPCFTLSVKSNQNDRGDFYILRATILAESLDKLIHTAADNDARDALIVNQDGFPQTQLHFWGNLLVKTPFLASISSQRSAVNVERLKIKDYPLIVSYSHIPKSPFNVLLIYKEPQNIIRSWFFLERKWFILSGFGLIFVVLLASGISTSLIKRIRKADIDRIAVLQKVELEHTHRLASLGRLSSGIAHEINNPLAIIHEKAGLIEDIISYSQGAPQNEENMKEFSRLMRSIQRAVQRCSTITHRLLGFARQMDVTIETVDLKAVITDILSFLEREARHRNITINQNFSEKHILIESDRGQLQQVFLNLINNAFDAVSNGGQITISIKNIGSPTKADDTMSFRSSSIKVIISDSGKGIAEEYVDHIFEPFFTEKKDKKTGLGLSITYGIVKELGGEIDVKSKVGRGTTFIVTLPGKR